MKGHESTIDLKHRNDNLPLGDLPKTALPFSGVCGGSGSDSDDEDDSDDEQDFDDTDDELSEAVSRDKMADMVEFVSLLLRPKN